MLHIDDVVKAAPVHFLCGLWGLLAAPIFAQEGLYAKADCRGIGVGTLRGARTQQRDIVLRRLGAVRGRTGKSTFCSALGPCSTTPTARRSAPAYWRERAIPSRPL